MTGRPLPALLLALACASAPPPQHPPSAVPSAAVEAMCGRARAEGMTADLRVVKTSQPLVTQGLISALASVADDRGKPAAVAAAGPVPVEPASCAKVMIESLDPKRDADVMVLQFSTPFSNPYSRRRQIGVVARLSLGNEAPLWYWIPIGERNGSWAASRPIILAIRD